MSERPGLNLHTHICRFCQETLFSRKECRQQGIEGQVFNTCFEHEAFKLYGMNLKSEEPEIQDPEGRNEGGCSYFENEHQTLTSSSGNSEESEDLVLVCPPPSITNSSELESSSVDMSNCGEGQEHENLFAKGFCMEMCQNNAGDSAAVREYEEQPLDLSTKGKNYIPLQSAAATSTSTISNIKQQPSTAAKSFASRMPILSSLLKNNFQVQGQNPYRIQLHRNPVHSFGHDRVSDNGYLELPFTMTSSLINDRGNRPLPAQPQPQLQEPSDSGKNTNKSGDAPGCQFEFPAHIQSLVTKDGRMFYGCSICVSTFTTTSGVEFHRYCSHPKIHLCANCVQSVPKKDGWKIYHAFKFYNENDIKSCEKCGCPALIPQYMRLAWESSQAFLCGWESQITGENEKNSASLLSQILLPLNNSTGSLNTSHKTEDPLPFHHLCVVMKKEAVNLNFNNFEKTTINQRISPLNFLGDQSQSSAPETGLMAAGAYGPYKSSSSNAHLPVMKLSRVEKCHVCEICSKAFTCSYNLKSHMLVHSGENPFECKFCRKRFRYRGNLSRHIISSCTVRRYLRNRNSAGTTDNQEEEQATSGNTVTSSSSKFSVDIGLEDGSKKADEISDDD